MKAGIKCLVRHIQIHNIVELVRYQIVFDLNKNV